MKRLSAFDRLASGRGSWARSTRWMTAFGTCIEVMLTSSVPSVNVSPEVQSMPNSATMSPARRSSMSSISSACMRTRRPTLCFFLVRVLKMGLPLSTRALVDAHVGQLAEAAFLELEREPDERLGRRPTRHSIFSSFLSRCRARCSRRRPGSAGSAHAVEQELHALVLEGRAHEHRGQLELDRRACGSRP